jgi:hypothetical protein
MLRSKSILLRLVEKRIGEDEPTSLGPNASRDSRTWLRPCLNHLTVNAVGVVLYTILMHNRFSAEALVEAALIGGFLIGYAENPLTLKNI